MSAELQTRIEAGDLAFLDGLGLLGSIAAQRWFGGKGREALDARVREAGTAPGGPPHLSLALVEVRYAQSAHELYHLPLGFRPASEGWNDAVVAEVGGWTVYDALADPALARELVHLMRAGTTLRIADAAVEFRSADGIAGDLADVRPMGAEQSNSSTVFDESLVLKVYRRVEAGVNPELELLRFLTAREFPHIAALRGWVAYQGDPMDATLAVLQDFVASHGDGWTLALATIGRDPGWLPARARRLGEVTGRLHSVLASDSGDAAFAPEEPSTEALGLLTASVDEEIESVFLGLPARPELAPIAGRGEEVREHLRERSHLGAAGRVIRHHGDYHLGQALWTEQEDWVVLDFEGEPARSLLERRRKRSPLRDVAGMLRSFAYAASASTLLRGVDAPAGWEAECRREFLAGYFDAVDPSLLPGGGEATMRLLSVFELEKAVYELRYEIDNRPEWVGIPVAGILRLLEEAA